MKSRIEVHDLSEFADDERCMLCGSEHCDTQLHTVNAAVIHARREYLLRLRVGLRVNVKKPATPAHLLG